MLNWLIAKLLGFTQIPSPPMYVVKHKGRECARVYTKEEALAFIRTDFNLVDWKFTFNSRCSTKKPITALRKQHRSEFKISKLKD